MEKLTGISARAQRDARTKLQEYGLIEYHPRPGGSYRYVICDPTTGKPYPGDPKAKIPYVPKVQRDQGRSLPGHTDKARMRGATRAPSEGGLSPDSVSTVHGIPLKFE